MAKRNQYKYNAKMHKLPLSTNVIGLLLLSVAGVLGYCVFDAQCNTLGNEIRRKEVEKRNLENEYLREEARWNASKTPAKLEEALIAHGLVMQYPKEEQLVRMDRKGRPVQGQLSIAKFHRNPQGTDPIAKHK